MTLHAKRYHLALKIIFEFIVPCYKHASTGLIGEVSLICELLLLSYSPPKSVDTQTNNWRKMPLNDLIDFLSTTVSCKQDGLCESLCVFLAVLLGCSYSQKLKIRNM